MKSPAPPALLRSQVCFGMSLKYEEKQRRCRNAALACRADPTGSWGRRSRRTPGPSTGKYLLDIWHGGNKHNPCLRHYLLLGLCRREIMSVEKNLNLHPIGPWVLSGGRGGGLICNFHSRWQKKRKETRGGEVEERWRRNHV